MITMNAIEIQINIPYKKKPQQQQKNNNKTTTTIDRKHSDLTYYCIK